MSNEVLCGGCGKVHPLWIGVNAKPANCSECGTQVEQRHVEQHEVQPQFNGSGGKVNSWWMVVGLSAMALLLIALILLLLLFFLYQPFADNPKGQVTSTANTVSNPNDKPADKPTDKPADKPAPENNESKASPGEKPDQSVNQSIEELPMLRLPSDNPNQLGVGLLGQKNEASLFGVQVVAERVAYAIDYSSSMNGRNLERAKRELNDSVGRLTEHQIFTVLLFNTIATSTPEFTEKPANRQAKNGLVQWLNQNLADGGTNPLPALEIILVGDYDVVFLVSDGEFPLDTVNKIRKLNRNKIPISTSSLSIDSQTLKIIAKENNGQYITVR